MNTFSLKRTAHLICISMCFAHPLYSMEQANPAQALEAAGEALDNAQEALAQAQAAVEAVGAAIETGAPEEPEDNPALRTVPLSWSQRMNLRARYMAGACHQYVQNAYRAIRPAHEARAPLYAVADLLAEDNTEVQALEGAAALLDDNNNDVAAVPAVENVVEDAAEVLQDPAVSWRTRLHDATSAYVLKARTLAGRITRKDCLAAASLLASAIIAQDWATAVRIYYKAGLLSLADVQLKLFAGASLFSIFGGAGAYLGRHWFQRPAQEAPAPEEAAVVHPEGGNDDDAPSTGARSASTDAPATPVTPTPAPAQEEVSSSSVDALSIPAHTDYADVLQVEPARPELTDDEGGAAAAAAQPAPSPLALEGEATTTPSTESTYATPQWELREASREMTPAVAPASPRTLRNLRTTLTTLFTTPVRPPVVAAATVAISPVLEQGSEDAASSQEENQAEEVQEDVASTGNSSVLVHAVNLLGNAAVGVRNRISPSQSREVSPSQSPAQNSSPTEQFAPTDAQVSPRLESAARRVERIMHHAADE